MNISLSIGLLALGVVLTSADAQTQQTSQSAPDPSATVQQGQDPNSQSKKGRTKKSKRKRNRRSRATDQNNRMNTDGTMSQDAASYRGGSVSSGTTMNNSNVTNYNSQQVTTAPTGVGSTHGTPTVPASTERRTSKAEESPNLNQRSSTGTGSAVAGAITNAPTVPVSAASPSTSVGDFTSAQPDYTTLQNALQATNLDKELRGAGPFTVFAPSNSAFKKLPPPIQNTLLDGQNQHTLKQLLAYHIIKGTVDSKELARQINAGHGKTQIKTTSGHKLTAQIGSNGQLMLTDESGNTASIDTPDQMQANGVVHGITNVLRPRNTRFK